MNRSRLLSLLGQLVTKTADGAPPGAVADELERAAGLVRGAAAARPQGPVAAPSAPLPAPQGAPSALVPSKPEVIQAAGIEILPPGQLEMQDTVNDAVGVSEAAALAAEQVKRKDVIEMVARAIVLYWIARTGRDSARAKVTAGRMKKVRARLEEGYTVDEIRQAIANIADSPYHNGTEGRRYDTLDLICRNGEKLESYRDYGDAPIGAHEIEELERDPIQKAKAEKVRNALNTSLRRIRQKMRAAMQANDHAAYGKLRKEEERVKQEVRGLTQ